MTVIISVSLNVRTTVELGSNPIPVIFTEAPIGSEVELSVMVGAIEDVSVNDLTMNLMMNWILEPLCGTPCQ